MFDGDEYFYSRDGSVGSEQTSAASATPTTSTARRGRGGGRGRGRGGRGRGAGRAAAAAGLDGVSIDSTDDREATPARRGRGAGRGRGRGRAASRGAAAYSPPASISRSATPASVPVPPADGVPVKRKRGRPPKNRPSLPASVADSPVVASPRATTTAAAAAAARRRLTASASSHRAASALASSASASLDVVGGASVSGVVAPSSGLSRPPTPQASIVSSGSSVVVGTSQGPSSSRGAPGRPRRRLESPGGDTAVSLDSSRAPTERSRGGHQVGASTRASLNSARAAASAASSVRHDAQELLRQAQAEREERVARARERLLWRVKRFRDEEGREGVAAGPAPPTHAPLRLPSGDPASTVIQFEDRLADSDGAYTLARTHTAASHTATADASSASTVQRVPAELQLMPWSDRQGVKAERASRVIGGHDPAATVSSFLCARASSSPATMTESMGDSPYVVSLLQRAGLADPSGRVMAARHDDHPAATAQLSPYALSPTSSTEAPTCYLDRLVQEAASRVTSTESSHFMTGWEQYAERVAATLAASSDSLTRSDRTAARGGAGGGADAGAVSTAFSVSPLLMDGLACHAQPLLSLYGPRVPRAGSFLAAWQHSRAHTEAPQMSRLVKREPTSDDAQGKLAAAPHPSARAPRIMRHGVQSVVVPLVVGSYAQLVDATSRDRSHVWTVYVRGLFDGHPGSVATATESSRPCRPEDAAVPTTPATTPDTPHDIEENYLAQFIESVTFVLDKSFTPCVRTLYRPPYEVTEHGWGEFVVSIHVHLRYQGYKHTAEARRLRHEVRHFAFTSHGRAALQGTSPLTTGRALFDPVTNSHTLFGGTATNNAATAVEEPDPRLPVTATSPGDTPTSPTAAQPGESAHQEPASAATGVGGASGGCAPRGVGVNPHTDSRHQSFAQQLLDMNHCSAIRPLVYRGPLLPPHLQSCSSESSETDEDTEEAKIEGGDESHSPPFRGRVKLEKEPGQVPETPSRRGVTWMSALKEETLSSGHGELALDVDGETEDHTDLLSNSPESPGPTSRALSVEDVSNAQGHPGATRSTWAPPPPRRGPGRPAPSEAARRTRLRKAAAHAAARRDAARQLEGSVTDNNVVILTHALRFSHRTTLPAGLPPTGDCRTDLARREQYSGYVLVPDPVVTEQYDEVVIPLIETDRPCVPLAEATSVGCDDWHPAENTADQRLLLAASVLETNCRRVLHHYLRERGLARECEQRAVGGGGGGHWSSAHKRTTSGVGGTVEGLGGDQADLAAAPASLAKAVASLSASRAGALSCWPHVVHSGDAAVRDALLAGSYLTSLASTARAEGWLAHSLTENHAYWFDTADSTSNDGEGGKSSAPSPQKPSAAVLTVTASTTTTRPGPAATAYVAVSPLPLPYLLTSLEFDLLSLLLLLPAFDATWETRAVMRRWVGPQASVSATALLSPTVLSQLVSPGDVSLSTSSRAVAPRTARQQSLLTSATTAAAVHGQTVPLPDLASTLHADARHLADECDALLCYPRWRPAEVSAVAALAAATCAPAAYSLAATTAGTARSPAPPSVPSFTSGQPCGLFGAEKDVERLQLHRDALLRAIHEMRQEISQRQAIEVLKRL